MSIQKEILVKQFGSLTLYPTRRLVYSTDGRLIRLTSKELSLLLYFLDRIDQPADRQQILTDVWGDGYQGGDRTVDYHVSMLRKRIGPLIERDYTFAYKRDLRAYGIIKK